MQNKIKKNLNRLIQPNSLFLIRLIKRIKSNALITLTKTYLNFKIIQI